MACRARGSGRQRATPTPSERGFSSRAITGTAITYALRVMAGFTNFRVTRYPECLRIDPHRPISDGREAAVDGQPRPIHVACFV
jgi:hypothetical protein